MNPFGTDTTVAEYPQETQAIAVDQGNDGPEQLVTLADLRALLRLLKLVSLYAERSTRHLVRRELLALGLDSFTVDERAPGGRSNVLEAEQLLAEYHQHEPPAWERQA